MWHNNTPHYKKRKFSKGGACPTSLSERCSSRRFSLSLSSRGYLNDGKEATGHFMLRRSSFCRQLAWLRDCAPGIRVNVHETLCHLFVLICSSIWFSFSSLWLLQYGTFWETCYFLLLILCCFALFRFVFSFKEAPTNQKLEHKYK